MLRRVAYWAAVLVVSLATVIGLILFLESRDQSQVDTPGALTPVIGLLASASLDPRRALAH